MVSQEVLHGGSRAGGIEALAGIWKTQIENAILLENAQLMFKRSDRILHMLKHVICDDKIQ
jgi:hypothetical protein